MSLDAMRLPGFMVADLYKNTLVMPVDGESKKEATPEMPAGYKYLGNNLQKTVLVTHSSDAVFLPEIHLTFLTKMLEACKMNIGDVAIVNDASAPVIINELKQQFSPKIIVLFGIEPVQIKLPINFPTFKIQAYDGCQYLYAPALDILNTDTAEGKLLKSKLWVCLRALFEI